MGDVCVCVCVYVWVIAVSSWTLVHAWCGQYEFDVMIVWLRVGFDHVLPEQSQRVHVSTHVH